MRRTILFRTSLKQAKFIEILLRIHKSIIKDVNYSKLIFKNLVKKFEEIQDSKNLK